MKAIIQILHVNEVKKGVSKTGRPYELQTAFAMLLDESGSPQAVGELLMPRDMPEPPKPGLYTGVYQFGVDDKKNIGARLVSLTPTALPKHRSMASPPAAA